MATLTFKTELGDDEWTEVAVGADVSSFGLMALSGQVLICVKDTAPDMDEDQIMPITAADTRELAMELPADMTLYARGEEGRALIAGYKVPRA